MSIIVYPHMIGFNTISGGRTLTEILAGAIHWYLSYNWSWYFEKAFIVCGTYSEHEATELATNLVSKAGRQACWVFFFVIFRKSNGNISCNHGCCRLSGFKCFGRIEVYNFVVPIVAEALMSAKNGRISEPSWLVYVYTSDIWLSSSGVYHW